MIKPQLQQQILEYGNSLHVSQRGLFQRAVQYPRWKKRWFQAFAFDEDFAEVETLEELRALDSWQSFTNKNDDPTFLEEENAFVAFLKFLDGILWSPLILAIFAPFVKDVCLKAITWHSVSSELLIEAIALGVLVDNEKLSM